MKYIDTYLRNKINKYIEKYHLKIHKEKFDPTFRILTEPYFRIFLKKYFEPIEDTHYYSFAFRPEVSHGYPVTTCSKMSEPCIYFSI